MLVWIASYPRSGNSLFRITLRDAFGVDRIGNVHRPDLALGYVADRPREERDAALPPEFAGLARDELLEAVRERPEPYFLKTHRLADSADPSPCIYLVREDVMRSSPTPISSPRAAALPRPVARRAARRPHQLRGTDLRRLVDERRALADPFRADR